MAVANALQNDVVSSPMAVANVATAEELTRAVAVANVITQVRGPTHFLFPLRGGGFRDVPSLNSILYCIEYLLYLKQLKTPPW